MHITLRVIIEAQIETLCHRTVTNRSMKSPTDNREVAIPKKAVVSATYTQKVVGACALGSRSSCPKPFAVAICMRMAKARTNT